MLENQVKTVFLAIGSNLGNRLKYIELAKFKLQLNNIKIIRSSSNYESLSWPNPKNPKFINIVIKVETYLSPIKLLSICKKIENDLGRKRFKKNEPRTCDIDIIDYDQKILNIKRPLKLTIPHPFIEHRNFVLLPLFEIAQNWRHPVTKVKIGKLISFLKEEDLRSIKQI